MERWNTMEGPPPAPPKGMRWVRNALVPNMLVLDGELPPPPVRERVMAWKGWAILWGIVGMLAMSAFIWSMTTY